MFQIDPTVLPHIEALESDHERQERLRQQRLRQQAYDAYIRNRLERLHQQAYYDDYDDHIRKLENKITVYKKFNLAIIAYAVAVTVISIVVGAGHA